MTIARTDAAGGALLPELLAFTSSLAQDRALLKEDLLGSLAHLAMLAKTGIVAREHAAPLKAALLELWEAARAGTLRLPDEEDVHMAVEALLAERLGEGAGFLHTARSRNDQVALDLRLHVREACAQALEAIADLVDLLVARAGDEWDVLLPSYTHRQRAQPVSAAYFLAAYASMLARDADAFTFAMTQADALPLGVGAIAGTSLPIDRELSRGLLGFSRLTLNGMDTVGDRDFALDYVYAASRLLLHTSRLCADLVDFASSEFGYIKLDGSISFGSSMMPQKRNPDVFELVRGKSGRGVGNLVALLVTVKGLPVGYNRDLQEDRLPILETAPLVHGVLAALTLALPKVRFDKDRCLAALEADATQATDLAERLVEGGMPFRQAYGLVGALVRRCLDEGRPLGQVTAEQAAAVDPRLAGAFFAPLGPAESVARKRSAGSTGPAALRAQLAELTALAKAARERAAAIPRLEALFSKVKEASS